MYSPVGVVWLFSISVRGAQGHPNPCSSACEDEFVARCVPFHCNGYAKSPEPCFDQVAEGANGPLGAACETGCVVTDAMLDARNLPACSGPEGGGGGGGGDSARAEAGDEIDPAVGLVVVVGDSLLDGKGSTEGVFEGTLAERLETKVYNNAVGGANFEEIMDMRACSSYDACTKWAIVDGGINNDGEFGSGPSMEDFVERERAAGASIIIIGYPPTLGGASGPTYDAMMESFATLAAASDDVYFVDPRTHPIMGDPGNPDSREWRAGDNEHPSPLAGEWLANEAAEYILGGGGSDG